MPPAAPPAASLAPFMGNRSLPFPPTPFLPPTPRACLRSGPRGICTRLALWQAALRNEVEPTTGSEQGVFRGSSCAERSTGSKDEGRRKGC